MSATKEVLEYNLLFIMTYIFFLTCILFPNFLFYFRALNEKDFTTINSIFLIDYLEKSFSLVLLIQTGPLFFF